MTNRIERDLMSKQFAKKLFNFPPNSLKRIGKTVAVSAGMGIRIVKGEKYTPDMLKQSFEEMGTTYIKIGQFIASMPSIFPKKYVEAFQNCLDQTTPLPFSYVQEVLETELLANSEKQLSDFFSYIDESPLASASIAQVHAATLVDGTEVVLKVQKPNVDIIIETDLGMLHGASKLMDLVLPEIKIASISPILDEIRTQMSAETNFIKEAENINDFHKFLASTNNNQVTAPKVIEALTTEKVLTMSRLDGVSMVDTDAMRQYCADPANVIALTINTWFASVMQARNFHADLHAGNLMLLKDGRIGFIDFGIVGHVKPESWRACHGMVDAIQRQDYYMMAECMVDVGMTKDRNQIDVLKLSEDIKVTIEMVNNNQDIIIDSMNDLNNMKTINPSNLTESMDGINKLLLEIVEVAKQHGIQFPRDFILLIKQMLYFDRFLQILAPDMSIFDDKKINMMG